MAEQGGSAEPGSEAPPPTEDSGAPKEAAAPTTEAAAPAPAPAAAAEPPPPKREIPPEVLERVGEKKNLDAFSDDELKAVLKEYYDRWVASESEVYDIAYTVKVKDMQIQELEMEVSDMRGKFIIPKLKKVHNFKLMSED